MVASQYYPFWSSPKKNTYKISSAKMKATFDDREILTKENLKHFHLDDDE